MQLYVQSKVHALSCSQELSTNQCNKHNLFFTLHFAAPEKQKLSFISIKSCCEKKKKICFELQDTHARKIQVKCYNNMVLQYKTQTKLSPFNLPQHCRLLPCATGIWTQLPSLHFLYVRQKEFVVSGKSWNTYCTGNKTYILKLKNSMGVNLLCCGWIKELHTVLKVNMMSSKLYLQKLKEISKKVCHANER